MGRTFILLGFALLVVCAMVSRTASRRLFAQADEEVKESLVRIFEEMKLWTTGPLMIMLVAYFAASIVSREHETTWLAAMVGILFVHLLVCQVVLVRKLKPLNLSMAYILKLLVGRNLPYWGLFGILAAVLVIKLITGNATGVNPL